MRKPLHQSSCETRSCSAVSALAASVLLSTPAVSGRSRPRSMPPTGQLMIARIEKVIGVEIASKFGVASDTTVLLAQLRLQEYLYAMLTVRTLQSPQNSSTSLAQSALIPRSSSYNPQDIIPSS